MIFNSIEFLVFGLLFFILWPVFRKKDNPRWLFITTASFIFYGWWDWRFLFLILFSGLVDYFAGLLMVHFDKHKRWILSLSILTNLGSLSIFKYSTFIATIISDLASLFYIDIELTGAIPKFALILPVGISFYTFQSMSYTIDVYKGKMKPTRNVLHFFSYLSMFPQLVAGPIIRAKDFLHQLNSYRIPNKDEVWNGFKLIVYGLVQKVVIADNLSFLVDSAYEGKFGFDGVIYWWIVAVAFSFQIYNDFSGYSLIARGLAKLMGYHFRMNFDHPYISKSFKEFWSRWHISLSTWFRDYVYIPIGGSRGGNLLTVAAITITMLASGIWHGANYTFIIWASLHILYLLFERFTKWNKSPKIPVFIKVMTTFTFTTIAWVYFRADDVNQANVIVMNLIDFTDVNLSFVKFYFNSLVFLGLGVLIETMVFFRKTNVVMKKWLYKMNMDVVLIMLSILAILMFRGEGKQFIYFQF